MPGFPLCYPTFVHKFCDPETCFSHTFPPPNTRKAALSSFSPSLLRRAAVGGRKVDEKQVGLASRKSTSLPIPSPAQSEQRIEEAKRRSLVICPFLQVRASLGLGVGSLLCFSMWTCTGALPRCSTRELMMHVACPLSLLLIPLSPHKSTGPKSPQPSRSPPRRSWRRRVGERAGKHRQAPVASIGMCWCH